MFTHPASACQKLLVPDARPAEKAYLRQGLTLGDVAPGLFYRPSLLIPGAPKIAWLARLAVAVGLALGTPGGPTRAVGLHDPVEIEAHTRSTVAAQMADMGVEDVLFRGVRSVMLPRAEGPSGVAVCGTAEDVEGDPDGNVWGMHFIAFYERDVQGKATLVGEPVFTRVGQSGNATADDLCDAAVATANAQSRPHVARLRL